MKRNRRSALTEAARSSPLFQATETAGVELTKLIDFIEYHNPDIDRATATLTAAFALHELRAAFLEEPEMMQQLRAIALWFSQR
ncbi:MAG: hypothetical protein KME31_30570 [Tolypothrix carrinoi HA7290-LM1]|jgi:hypothetical protein|nr:hypothetical protein [Tolypothrix carrinoi HA7290-LM1]